jgi:hypothetical protein
MAWPENYSSLLGGTRTRHRDAWPSLRRADLEAAAKRPRLLTGVTRSSKG